MKTLVIVSHPDIQDSGSQKYLKDSLPASEEVIYHHLETTYPDGKIDIEQEQRLLAEAQRIVLQFPFYWYAAPAVMKQWLDEVLTEGFAYGPKGNVLKGKELGLVMVIGAAEKEYQVGGREGFTISALTTPFQAMAHKLGMTFMKPLAIHQFQYMEELDKMRLLITYQQYLMMKQTDSLRGKEAWFLENLDHFTQVGLPANGDFVLEQIVEKIEDTRMELDEIQMYLDGLF